MYSWPVTVRRYTVEPQQVDVGQVPFDKTVEKEVIIHNGGKVPVPFKVQAGNLSRPNVVEVMPATGTVGPGAHLALKLTVCRMVFAVAHAFACGKSNVASMLAVGSAGCLYAAASVTPCMLILDNRVGPSL